MDGGEAAKGTEPVSAAGAGDVNISVELETKGARAENCDNDDGLLCPSDLVGPVSNNLGGRRLETIQPGAILPLSLVICQPDEQAAGERASKHFLHLWRQATGVGRKPGQQAVNEWAGDSSFQETWTRPSNRQRGPSKGAL